MPMVVIEMHCTCGAYQRVVTSRFTMPMSTPSSGAITRVTITRSDSRSTSGSPANPTERRVGVPTTGHERCDCWTIYV